MTDDNARWMTYEALAKARGTSKHAAVVLVRRRKWPRQTDNAGHTMALVPAEWATAQKENVLEKTNTISAPDSERHDTGHAIAVLEQALAALTAAHDRERAALEERAIRAEGEARAAQDALRQVQQAEAQARAQGRWARLRRAWRG